jgi:16S rRNA (cytidine1402-2'-O)-methyltransferase
LSDLILVTMPIGNNKDLTIRAREVLETAKYIVAEDTRVLRDFCKNNSIEIKASKVESFNDHAGNNKIEKVLSWLDHDNVAFVSDAGSPIVSDPAYPLVKTILESEHELRTIPGVSAVTTALELSGLPPSPFHFHAFIPRDNGKKDTFFEEMAGVYGTHIFFEGVSRVEKTMSHICEKFKEFDYCIARELTKTFETVHRFKGSEWESIKANITYKGEFVILLHNPNKVNAMNSDILKMATEIIENGAHPKKLSKLLSEITQKPTKEIYQLLLAKK